MYCMNRYLNQLNEQCLEREVERFANRLVIEMYLREIINLGVQNCSFHETIISDNTERGSLKLTRCSYWKKVHETENLSASECWNTNQNFHLSWSSLLPINLWSGVLCFFSSVRGGLDPIATQSNRLLGNPPYTLTKRLLGNLTDMRFAFGFCLALKSGFEFVYINFSPKHRSNSTTLLPGLNSCQFPAVSESR